MTIGQTSNIPRLAGRAARQGDPGSVAAILAADDPLVAIAGRLPRLLMRSGRRLPGVSVPDGRHSGRRHLGRSLGERLAGCALRLAQKGQERALATARQALLRQDRLRAERLGFAGVGE
ncbi:MAG TPA: hypothetical protein VFE41_22480 [Acetobacteraceae bacterium]|nr:hypothetical protein [Acetobacteraceae bacterium]